MIYTRTSGGGGESASRKDFRQPRLLSYDGDVVKVVAAAAEVAVVLSVVEVAVADDRGSGRSLIY